MPLAAALPFIGAAASVAGPIIGAVSANNAAKTQAQAATTATNDQVQAAQIGAQTQLHMYDQTRSDLMPYMQTGNAALSQLAQLFGLQLPGGGAGPGGISPNATATLENTPGYQFTRDQGVQALDRSAASRGLTLSGAQLKDAQSFGQQSALANAWQPYVSQLTGLSNLGENAGAGVGQAGTTTGANIGAQGISAANNAGGYLTAAGSNTAAGQIAVGNILQGGLSQLGAYAQQYAPAPGQTTGGPVPSELAGLY